MCKENNEKSSSQPGYLNIQTAELSLNCCFADVIKLNIFNEYYSLHTKAIVNRLTVNRSRNMLMPCFVQIG